jgi:hypothetical protein
MASVDVLISLVINIIGALGIIIGIIIGSRIRKKIDLQKLTIDQMYCY